MYISAYNHSLGTIAELDEQEFNAFAERLDGTLVLPDDEEYTDARTVWNGLINKYPVLIARASSAHDVAAAIQFAHENNLELAVQGGAHQQTGSAVAHQGLVINLSGMDDIAVDPDRRITWPLFLAF